MTDREQIEKLNGTVAAQSYLLEMLYTWALVLMDGPRAHEMIAIIRGAWADQALLPIPSAVQRNPTDLSDAAARAYALSFIERISVRAASERGTSH